MQLVRAQVCMAVDPAPGEVGLLLVVGLGQPGVHPEVEGAEVEAGQRVVAQEVAPALHHIVRVVHQQVCSAWPFMAIWATRRQIAALLLASDQCQLVFTHVGCGLGKPSAGLPLVLPTHWTCTLCSLQPSKMLGRDPRFRSLAPGVELPKKPSVPAATRWLGSRLFRNSEVLASHPWNQQQ